MNVENLVRAGVALVIGLHLTGDVYLNATPDKDEVADVTNSLKAELTVPCIRWAASEPLSKLEIEAKESIEDILGGKVNHKNLCDWVL